MVTSGRPPRARGNTRALACAALLLAAAALAAWWPLQHNGFVSFDDPQYVTDNWEVRAGLGARGFAWAFTAVRASNWHPLTWLSHMADVSLFGLDPAGHHLASLALHAGAGLLLLLLLARLTGEVLPAALAAGLFLLHPIAVESVAWASERKSVLSTLLWMAAGLAYVRFVRRRGAGAYALLLAAFGAGLLAKPMLVTLPCTLLLLDWWPLGRIGPPAAAHGGARGRALREALVEKLPLFALAAASSAVTLAVQGRGGALGTLRAWPLGLRLENAAVSYAAYLRKLAWPTDLAVFYPYPEAGLPLGRVLAAAALLALLAAAALVLRRRQPWLPVGLLWFLGTLVPVIGIVKAGSHALADRYAYVPMVGVFVAVAWALTRAPVSRSALRRALPAAALALALALALATRRQLAFWRDDLALTGRALAVTGENWLAREVRGIALSDAGRLAEAEREFAESLRQNPGNFGAHYNLGLALARAGRLEEAARELAEAVRLRPGYGAAWSSLGGVLIGRGRGEEAVPALRTALRLDPGDFKAHNNLGIALAKGGRMAEALGHFEAAARLAPGAPGVRDNLRSARQALGAGKIMLDKAEPRE